MFDGPYFVHWFSTLMTELEQMSLSNAIIAMDISKYHKGLPGDTPNGSQKISMLQGTCRRWSIPLDNMEDNAVLWQNFPTHGCECSTVVIPKAATADHTDIFPPLYHSDLQPIELVWTTIKGEIGRQYDISTTPGGRTSAHGCCIHQCHWASYLWLHSHVGATHMELKKCIGSSSGDCNEYFLQNTVSCPSVNGCRGSLAGCRISTRGCILHIARSYGIQGRRDCAHHVELTPSSIESRSWRVRPTVAQFKLTSRAEVVSGFVNE